MGAGLAGVARADVAAGHVGGAVASATGAGCAKMAAVDTLSVLGLTAGPASASGS